MKRSTKAIVAGVAVGGFAAFFFLAPVFYWFTAYGPAIRLSEGPIPAFTAYRSLGCEFLGYGDSYSTPFYENGQNVEGLAFSCASPPVPG